MLWTTGSLSQEGGRALGAQAGERRSFKGRIYAGPPCGRNAVQYDPGSATIGDLLGTRVPMIVGPELVSGLRKNHLKNTSVRHWVPIFLDYASSSFRQRLQQLVQ